jgi:hypothetical protein
VDACRLRDDRHHGLRALDAIIEFAAGSSTSCPADEKRNQCNIVIKSKWFQDPRPQLALKALLAPLTRENLPFRAVEKKSLKARVNSPHICSSAGLAWFRARRKWSRFW